METRQDVIAHTDQPLKEKPEWLRERLEWFQDQKFGLILHWGPYALWDCCESWPLSPGDEWARNDGMECWTSRGKDLELFQRDYWALNRSFNPIKYDAEKWAEVAKHAGIRYVAMTTKHHDGFCMWDTSTTEYRITGPECPFHTDPRSDVYMGLCDAFQSRGMAISCYFSKADWHSPHYWSPDKPVVTRQANTQGTPEWDKFVDFTHRQIRELMTNYGKIDILWLDAGWVKDERNESLDMPKMIAMARELQPGLIVANRTVGDEFEDFITPEHQIPDAPLDEPWESCLCMAENWKYHPRDVYRSTSEILRMLIDIVSKGGNFLLGVGPTPEGEFPKPAMERLREIGDWMTVNGEAIYATRAIAPYSEGETRFTRQGNRVFAFLLDEAVHGLQALRPSAGAELRLLGSDDPVSFWESEGGIEFRLPDSAGNLPRPLVLNFSLEPS
ncbi:alpha-L-fucosidase [Fimbriimonas ginsengisoli]|uniref:alpha-L-fucosidase n=1 Tax=Fimbriimonas ginsengisoli Gsoil 348 TaxID=661478 RepID=A0A068NRG2_FIMGI|nr:alpha-L-fucosidase [Fimbriimonas ginsengisoli]AIE84189.1 alpha-L-fucosidase [Fimbriimonas ginsengisoli Gsoil 348]